MRRRLAAMIFALAAPAAGAGGSSFELSGTVLDESGLGLSGATLTLLHESTGQSRTTTTNELGYYSIAALSPGVYTLTARLSGYATSRFAGLRYFADTKPIFNVTLKLREVQESMTFTGEAPLLNVSQSQVGLSVEERQLQELPLERRDYLELAVLEGSAQEIEEASLGEEPRLGAPLVSLNGADAHYTTYLLDGFQNTREQHGVVLAEVDPSAIEEFRVVSGPFSAEYGRSLSGVVSASTRAGGNDFHGSLFALIRPGGWDAADPLSGEDTALDRKDLGITFSGPVLRENTHFFTSVEIRDQDREVVVTAPFDGGRFQGLYGLPSDRLRALAKLSHLAGARHRWTLTGLFANQSSVEGVGGFQLFENRADVEDDEAALLGALVSEIGPALSELRVGLSFERFRASAPPPPAGPAIRHPTLGYAGNPQALEVAEEDHLQVSETISLTAGTHALKLGVQFLRIGSTTDLLRFEDGLVIHPPFEGSDPILTWQRAGPSRAGSPLERREWHLQPFFQDDWQLTPWVTLNLGLRWEKESSVPDRDNFAPQLGFHWDATRDGRTSVRGGYGIHYSSVFSLVDTLERLYGASGRGVIAAPGGAVASLAENLYLEAPVFAEGSRQAPHAHHLNAGIEREWAPSLSVAVDAAHVRGSDLILPLDVNAPRFFDYSRGGTRSVVEADASRPFGAPGSPIPAGVSFWLPSGFPFSGYRDLYLLASRGESRFWSLRVRATRRYATSFMLQAVYQWSRARSDGDDFRVESSLPLDPDRTDREWGRSATDIPHSLVVNGIWDAPFQLRVAAILRARSGRPIDPRVGLDLDGDLKLRERAFADGEIFERNSFRAPAVATLDLSVGRSWELGQTRRLSLAVEAFNLTNRLNPLQILDSYGPGPTPLPSFLRVVQADSSRQFQLSARFAF